jgi:phosphoribosylamine-glycine ligase
MAKAIKFLPTKDYKRIGEGDTGLNTGGMGTVSPVPYVDIFDGKNRNAHCKTNN